MRRALAAIVLLTALTAAPSTAAAQVAGWEGTLGYVDVLLGAGGIPLRHLDVAVAPDGRHVYGIDERGRIRAYLREGSFGLRRLAGTAGCVAPTASRGCAAVGPLPHERAQIAVSLDGRTVFVAGVGVAALQRDPATGVLSAPAGGSGCVALTAPACGAPGESVMLAEPVPGPVVHASTADRIVTLRRDDATGALAHAGCIAGASVPGCRDARGSGWTHTLKASAGGDVVFAAGGGEGRVSAAVLTTAPDGTLTQPEGAAGLPLDGAALGCTEDDGGCEDVSVLVSPAGGLLALTTSIDYVAETVRFRRDPVTGAVTPAPCNDGLHCSTLTSPAVFSPDGRQLYTTTYRTISESGRGGAFLQTRHVDPATGELAKAPSDYPAVILDLADTDGPLRDLAALPDGAAVVTTDLEVLGRRRAVPPAIRIGRPSRCKRGRARVAIRVRDRLPRSKVDAFAFWQLGLDIPNPVGRRVARRATFTLTVRRPRDREEPVTVAVVATGRDGVPFKGKRTFRVCSS